MIDVSKRDRPGGRAPAPPPLPPGRLLLEPHWVQPGDVICNATVTKPETAPVMRSLQNTNTGEWQFYDFHDRLIAIFSPGTQVLVRRPPDDCPPEGIPRRFTIVRTEER